MVWAQNDNLYFTYIEYKFMKTRLKKIFNPQIDPINKIFISSKNILHNFEYLRNLQPQSSIFPVLKSNAYWHWLVNITKILAKTDAPYLAVDSFPEYQIVKQYSNKNILILWETNKKNYKKFKFSRATFCVYNIETIKYLAKLKKSIKIHLFLDTGMHREWVNENELINILEFLKSYPKIYVEWVLSHLYGADSEDNSSIIEQIKLFKQMYHIIIDYWHNPIRKHIGNSAWLFKIQDNFFNAYRPWLSLYWYSPLSENDQYYKLTSKLEPAITVISKIVSLHDVVPDQWVGYNYTRISSDNSKIACIPFWYAEWLPRSASNKINFKYQDCIVPQVGTICMNLCCLDINQEASIWDTIEIIWLEWENSIQNLAVNSDKIIYETLVWLDKNIRREILH